MKAQMSSSTGLPPVLSGQGSPRRASQINIKDLNINSSDSPSSKMRSTNNTKFFAPSERSSEINMARGSVVRDSSQGYSSKAHQSAQQQNHPRVTGTQYPQSKKTSSVFGNLAAFSKDNNGGAGNKAGFFSEIQTARVSQ